METRADLRPAGNCPPQSYLSNKNSKLYYILLFYKMHKTIVRFASFTKKLKEIRIILDPKCASSKGARCDAWKFYHFHYIISKT